MSRKPARAWALAVALCSPFAPLAGETFTISPAVTTSGDEEFERVANALKPGDELVLRGGEYSQTGRRAITCVGTADQPIVIRAADGEKPILLRPEDPRASYGHNGMEVVDSAYLIIRGLTFRYGSSGVRFIRGNHVTFEDCEVSHTGNNALTMNSGSTDSFIVRRNHLHHTGLLDSSLGDTEGEGMYIGCNNGNCVASNHVIENNYIHHLRATSDGGNDGIEIKVGSHGNIIRDNVIHDTTIGQRYPGIFVYGVGDPATQAPNVVEGNVIWNSGEGILVVSDAIVRNNIVLASVTGISAYKHSQVPVLRNVTIANNTIVGHSDEGLFIRWSGASNMTLANNAVFNPGRQAVKASGMTGGGITLSRNFFEGGLEGVSNDGAAFLGGGRAQDAFAAVPGLGGPGIDVLRSDLWPAVGSPLRGAADPARAPAADFNGVSRAAPHDVGAYHAGAVADNPGWKIAETFKEAEGEAKDTVAPAPPRDVTVR